MQTSERTLTRRGPVLPLVVLLPQHPALGPLLHASGAAGPGPDADGHALGRSRLHRSRPCGAGGLLQDRGNGRHVARQHGRRGWGGRDRRILLRRSIGHHGTGSGLGHVRSGRSVGRRTGRGMGHPGRGGSWRFGHPQAGGGNKGGWTGATFRHNGLGTTTGARKRGGIQERGHRLLQALVLLKQEGAQTLHLLGELHPARLQLPELPLLALQCGEQPGERGVVLLLLPGLVGQSSSRLIRLGRGTAGGLCRPGTRRSSRAGGAGCLFEALGFVGDGLLFGHGWREREREREGGRISWSIAG